MERKVGDKMKNIIEIKNLCRQFDKFVAVNNISFTVKQGELFAFLGTNGAGKSTTISMICTLLPKTSGSIIVDGFDTDKEAAKVRSRLGVVFQTNVLDDLLTVGDNLNTRARFQGLCGDELHCRINELRDVFGLSDIWKRPFGKLSGGQKRKCEIARAILNAAGNDRFSHNALHGGSGSSRQCIDTGKGQNLCRGNTRHIEKQVWKRHIKAAFFQFRGGHETTAGNRLHRKAKSGLCFAFD